MIAGWLSTRGGAVNRSLEGVAKLALLPESRRANEPCEVGRSSTERPVTTTRRKSAHTLLTVALMCDSTPRTAPKVKLHSRFVAPPNDSLRIRHNRSPAPRQTHHSHYPLLLTRKQQKSRWIRALFTRRQAGSSERRCPHPHQIPLQQQKDLLVSSNIDN